MAKSDSHGRYVITPAQILERFLINGSMGPVYKANDKFADFPLDVVASVKTIFECFPQEAIRVLREVSDNRKAPRKPPVLLALAAALSTADTRQHAAPIAEREIVTGTDQFVLTKAMLDLGRGKGTSFKKFSSKLYSKYDTVENRDQLALNLIKYRNRAGWTHRDILRVTHYSPTKENNDLFAWVVGKGPASHPLLEGFEKACKITTPGEAIALLGEYVGLPWEALPTSVLTSPEVWEALLPNLGNTALIRNLGRMQSYKMDLSGLSERIVRACSRLHPVAALSAYKVYGQGCGEKGSLSWRPDSKVSEALEAGFYSSFGNLKKSEKKVFFGIDVSGSMASPSTLTGVACREVAGAMAMAALRQQPYMIYGFTRSLVPLDIRHTHRLDSVLRTISRVDWGSTNCAAPMEFCLQNKIPDVDVFAIYTDNDTNSRSRPNEALNRYREKFNPNAKMAVVATSGGPFSIADPNDPGMMDFVGFDPTVPEVMLSFAEKTLV